MERNKTNATHDKQQIYKANGYITTKAETWANEALLLNLPALFSIYIIRDSILSLKYFVFNYTKWMISSIHCIFCY